MNGDSFQAAGESSTLVGLLRARALDDPERVLYTFLPDGEREAARLTLGRLDERARAVAALLQDGGLEGERALLLYPPGLEFIAAFFGCLYAKTVAVPAIPPRSSHALPGLRATIHDARPSVILTESSFLPRAARWLRRSVEGGDLRLLATDATAPDLAARWRPPSLTGDTLAFLQYTSGSTAAPRGVRVTHGNLLHNERSIRGAFRQDESSVVVGWLPLYHDMGLIGNVLQPLVAGSRCILMPPLAFLQRPLRWLDCISRYRATTSGGPNFAYELCLRKIEPEARARLDLGSWTVAFNGSETVRAETLEAFADAFGPCGFRREAFQPCYGLAEATLLVSGGRGRAEGTGGVNRARPKVAGRGRVSRPPSDGDGAREFVSCGEIAEGTRVVVVDPHRRARRRSGEVGELWVSGPGVAAGYWGRPEETERTFRARLTDGGAGAYLRTGDLGFVRGRELFVTGRLKELIIVRGRNYYPQDIELTVEKCHPAFGRAGGGAAFSAEVEGEERLVLVQEVPGGTDAGAAAAAARRAVAEEHGLQLYEIVFIRADTLPRTTSGKIQRHVCRELARTGGLKVVARDVITEGSPDPADVAPGRDELSAADSEERRPLVETYLRALTSRALGVPASRLDTGKPLASMGLDSLTAAELKNRVEEELGVKLRFEDLLGGSIKTLAGEAARQLEGGAAADGVSVAGARALPPAGEGASTQTNFADGAAGYPLSHGQRALWFLHGLAPEGGAYNLASAMRIRGPLNVEALRGAFQRLVERHPALRTTFAVRDGEPVRIVRPRAAVAFGVTDAACRDEAALRELLAEEAHRAFDLERGPLLRVRLFARGPEEHVALVVLHHIVADFRSLEVLAEELSALYRCTEEGLGTGTEPPSAESEPLAAEYESLVRRPEQSVAGTEGERHWDFWRRQLAGELPTLDLATDRPRPPVQTFRGASVSLDLGRELAGQVKALGRVHGATAYMTLLAAFYVLLHRYTGQDDLLVGTPTNGRSSAELANVVGYFVNPVALRADISGDPTFVEFLERVRRSALESFAHKDYPFTLLVERLQPPRDPSRAPLFQAMFVMQQASRPGLEALTPFALGEEGGRLALGSLDAESVKIERRAAQFDLTLTLAETGAGAVASLEYNADLFDAATAESLLSHYANLLVGIVTGPDVAVSALPLLSPEEQGLLRVGWNDTRGDFPRGALLHEMFEARAAAEPEAEALVFGRESMTYGELDARARRLARRLAEKDVGPETAVGVLMGRSPEMLVALLGILKAGGAYVALDPNHPEARIAFMLRDAGMRVLLTERRLLGRLPAHGAEVLCLDAAEWSETGGEEATGQEATGSGRGATADNLAYIIYTSGSTGTPKGVSIEHRSAVALLHWAGEVFGRDELEGVLASTSICFDISVFELFVPLGYGGRVILSENVLELPTLPAAPRVTLVNTVPSAMAELVRGAGLPASVRTVNLAGEALGRALVEDVYASGPVSRVYNLYGPSEDTTYSTWALIERGRDTAPPIGRPIANTRAYVLDARMRQVPVGVAGELYLAGEGLARGYLRRPALTAERFVPDPFSAAPGARLYRTGDLARHRRGGELEFLGRADSQVKVRGYRVELGEVEAALRRHEAVQGAVVTSGVAATGERRLAAYVVPHEGRGTDGAELRRFIRESLPDYMTPSAFVFLDSFPLTPSGKIDRRALPPPPPAGPGDDKIFVAPRTPVEEMMAGVWADVLGAGRVGVHDNFFDLGGHSLLAARLANRARQAFDVDVPLRSVFEAPTVAGMVERLEESLRARGSRADGSCAGEPRARAPLLQRVARGGALPLSFAQQQLWFLEQLGTGVAGYNLPVALRLKGRLNVAALEQSVRELVRRHEALRTTFVASDGEPAQLVSQPAFAGLPLVDLSGPAQAGAQAEAERLAIEEGRRPFDLARGLPFRVKLLRLGAGEHMLLFTAHHIIADEASLAILLRELMTLYESADAGLPAALPELPFQYADYAAWQRQRVRGEPLEGQLSYWRRQLGDGRPALDLPTDRPRPPVQSFRGANVSRALDAKLSAELKALGRARRATTFMTLLSAFYVLLYRYTGRRDIAVGAPVSTRNHPDVENVFGCFVNTLVLRTEVSGALTFEELLARVREVSLGGYAHQDVPFELLVRELRPERDPSFNSLFQVMFALQGEAPRVELSGAEAGVVGFDYGVAKCDLTLTAGTSEDGFVVSLEYSTDLFERATAERMLGHYVNLLEGVAARPGARLSDLPLLTDAERRLHLVEWNATSADYPQGTCVHELFEAQAARTPDAVAAASRGRSLTYRDLSTRSGRLARYLRRRGAGPESRVGILMGRSVEAVVALLGVLKSGAAYVPLDAGWPRARLQEVSKAAGLLAVLTERGLPEEAAAACAGAWAACPGDAEGEEVACEGVEDAALAGVEDGAADEDVAGVRVAADNLAYIIYTSGSTGTPKGVMVTHGGLVNHCFAVAGRYGLAACDRVLQFASLTFDVAAEELFPSLLKGCGVYISPAEASASPRELVDYMTGEAITVANLPSPLWHELVSDLAASAVALPPTLRLLVTGSDRTLAERLVLWRSIAGESVRWLNAYGTTETTITSSVYEPPAGVAEPDDAPSDAQSHAASVSIGRPVANTRVYLLDRDLQPVPRGARGELYVAGRGVARGYLNDPHLTAERFVPDPFSAEPGARMYRTGDLARHLPGGELDYLGRTDNQVKVRGFRVELGEVEAALRRHEAVREAVVLTHESAAGDRLLAAYFVSRRSPPPSSGELRAFLSEHLPDQMRPSSFVALDRLPLTPGGKLDRRALPAPAFVTRGDTVRAPRTPTEEVLAGVWADVLGLPGVGIHDNFFDLGGHSLLATRIMSRVREIFQVAVPLASLFESPTIVGMAEAIGAASRDGRGVRRGSLRRSDGDAPPPLSSSQERLWFVEQLRPGTSSYHISGAIRLRGRLDVAALQASLDEIVRRHEALRTTFAEVGGRLVQLVAPAARVALPVIDASQGEGSEEQTRRLVADESRRPFDLARGPLVRALLVREGDESHVFALTMHHIVGDAWSLAVFTGEFAALYEAFGGGRESPLAEPPVQYGDYAAWQQGWVRGEEAKAQRAYWKRQLGGGLAAPRLPADHARPPQPSGRGATLKFTLTEELSASLKALGRREGVTPFMTTLAAFKTLLRRYCASEDVVVGTDVAGRDHVETEGLIGFFVNSLVLRTDLSGDPTFRELLARVRAVTLDAYAHHELPFNEVVREVRPERDAGANPLFRVMFIMQNVPPPSLTLPGLTLTPFEVDDGSSAFDLSVSVEEDERGRLGGAFRFSTDLFEPATVARLVEDYVSLLHAAAERPDARLSALDVVRRGWREGVGPAGGPRGKFERLAATRPKAVSVSRGELVSASYLETGARLPLVLRPAAADVDLVAWAGANRELVEERLHTHGAILFRGFRLDSLSRFESFAAATSGRLAAYGERSSPRTGLGGHVYTSTDHPADQHILLHNEQSYTLAWPMKLWFFCRRPAARGGRTPVADSRNVARRLAGAGEALARRGVMYVRNYGDGLGLPWQEVFQTSERREVEEHCRRASIEVEWKDRGRLRTRQVRPAVRRHPRTGEIVWFNHALFFHVSSLPERAARESIIAGFGEEDLPYNTYYGDGAPIEPEVLAQIREAYRRETVGFDWRRGDVLMVDNMLVAHGREPFEGEREIAVVMGDPVSVER